MEQNEDRRYSSIVETTNVFILQFFIFGFRTGLWYYQFKICNYNVSFSFKS